MVAEPDPAQALISAWKAELPEVLGPSTELTKRVLVLAGELAAVNRRELAEFGLTGAEFDVLAALRRSGKPFRMKSNELSRALLLSTGGISNVVNRLVADGLVEREPDPDDGRSSLIRLTAKGVKLAEETVLAVSAAHAELFAGVPAAVLRTATRGLRELSEARSTARRSPPRTSR